MKKKLKILAIISLLSICGILMSSCENIDDMRSRHAVFVTEDKEIKIQKDGKTYVCIEGFEKEYRFTNPTRIYITESDVPVLLSDTLGAYALYYPDIEIIELDDEIYCLEELYEQYTENINGSLIDTFVIDIGRNTHTFTASETELLLSIWNDKNAEEIKDKTDWVQYFKKLSVSACNSNKSIYSTDNIYMTYNYTEKAYGLLVEYYVVNNYGGREAKHKVYTVPTDKEIEFRNIINKYYEIMSQSVIAP